MIGILKGKFWLYSYFGVNEKEGILFPPKFINNEHKYCIIKERANNYQTKIEPVRQKKVFPNLR